MSLTNITIIGGGACGISAFIELFLQLRIAKHHQQISITIIEENEEVGKGLAFGTRQPGHILNTQADLMGIHYTEPQHFSEWLIEHEGRVQQEVVDNRGQNEAFTTRRLYGDYLKEQFEHYFDLAKREGMQVAVIHARAEHVEQLESSFKIFLSDHEEAHQCDFLLLAPGTPVANNYPDLEDQPRYFGSPWPSSNILGNIPKDADIGILGSSLSAIDALMTLTDNDYSGKITFYSPDGMMPRVQPDTQEKVDCKYITRKNLHQIQRESLRNPTVKEIFRLFIKEAEDYAEKPIDWKSTARKEPAAQLLKQDIEIAKNGGDALINIPYSLRYESSEMWKSLDESEKLKFKKWLGNYWSVNRHCMPLVNAERVNGLFDSGKLQVVPGLKSVDFDTAKQKFVLTLDKEREAAEAYIINATGPASAVKMMKSVLMQNLAADGLIEPEPAGGIKINTETMQVVVDNQPYPNFYAIGHITNGLLLDVNAVWFNVKMIGNLSRHLISQIIGNAS